MAQRQHQQKMFSEAFLEGSNLFPSMRALTASHAKGTNSALWLWAGRKAKQQRKTGDGAPQGQKSHHTREVQQGKESSWREENPAGKNSGESPRSAEGSCEQPDAETRARQGSSRSLPQPRGTILPSGEPPQSTTETALRSQSLSGFSRLSPRPRALPAPAFESPKAKPRRSRGEGAV